MRLAVCTPFLTGMGGMERVVLKIARCYDAPVYCLQYDPDRTFDDFSRVDVREAGSKAAMLPFGRRILTAAEAGQYFYNLKFDEHYDVINPHQTPAEWVANNNRHVLLLGYSPNREAFDLYDWRQRRRNRLARLAFWAANQVYRKIEYQTVPKIDKVLAIGETSKEKFKRYLNVDAESCPLGIDRPKNRNITYEPFFFYPSRIVPEKDIEFAIEAFRQSGLVGWKLVIAGYSNNDKYLNHLKSLCNPGIEIETNISEQRLADLYASCSATVFTPVNEDFGLVPLEGMSYGKPCIGKDEGGIRETVVDCWDGYRVSTPEQMAERMRQLAAAPDACKVMGESGRKKVEEKFTWERFLFQFHQAAKEVANRA